MKAPDKIYLGIGPMSSDEPNKKYLYAEWYEEQKTLVESSAYIRKDALLEWAENKKKELLEMEITDVSAGMNGAFDLLINKLKSM